MKIRKIIRALSINLILSICLCTPVFAAENENNENTTKDKEPFVQIFPYEKTFVVTAYYSPVEGQNRYMRGSLEGDKKLNGNGTHGADGTPVYPGMIAAPKNIPFDTKMHIPGIGTVAVHDRGGAIVSKKNGSENNKYDRLDVWMGYGDEGLSRALSWGKRTVTVMVYGINESIIENVDFPDIQATEHTKDTETNKKTSSIKKEKKNNKIIPKASAQNTDTYGEKVLFAGNGLSFLESDLKPGYSGQAVSELQTELAKLNLFGMEPTGYYGEVTEHAVFKFQQIQGILNDKNDYGAGVFGPKTRKLMASIVNERIDTRKIIISKTEDKKLLINLDK